jgi:inositol 1,4,5-triphosphate receptor type 1
MEDVHEGDVVCLFCPDAKGFVYAQSPCSRYSQVTIYQVPTADGELTMLTDPVLPNIHSASFKILSENTMISQDNYSPLRISEYSDGKTQINRRLMYGRKIKLQHVASKLYLSVNTEY